MDARCFSFGPFVLIPQRQVMLRDATPVRIGSRALDILTQLVKRPGEVIDKQELIAQVWEGTFVDESNLKVHIAAIRKAIDDEAAHRSCIATVIGRGYRFVEPVRRLSYEGSRRLSEGRCILPDCSQPLIGRDKVVSQLVEQVSAHRLVTIVGAPGVGKTSVATVVAKSIFELHGSRACFVDFSNVVRHRGAADIVAKALGLDHQIDNSGEQLIAALDRRNMLLVFDGCESRMNEIAAMTESIVSSCPHIHILATSREALRATSEKLCRLPGLETPSLCMRMTAAQFQTYPAMQLFLERSADTLDQHPMAESEATAVASLCADLDGIPLAIEFAAAVVRNLGFSALPFLSKDDFFRFNAGMRTGSPRHQSLAATLDWSFDLLSNNERRVLAKLSRLNGGFDLEMGVHAVADANINRSEATACIANLVSKSLIERHETSDGHFRILNCIRFYAGSRLKVSDQLNNGDLIDFSRTRRLSEQQGWSVLSEHASTA
jgi:predicted ATPase/DNA-binding winged helix-turn-helix (wHTH) protein